ncbi:MAG: T9SS type A sorting domain-containing protein, partial [Bacteroidales bacterium]|nr:T9SS type A sorting domain-containing protein [Bacteroidales bacterium]
KYPNIIIGEYAFVYRDERDFAVGTRNTRGATGFGASEDCEINVNCSQGASYRVQQRGVARILVREGYSTGYCTGTLINNTSNDGTPYFLTANHCGPDATTSNFNQWKFRFNYEATGCTNPSYESSINYTDFTGCVKVAEGAMDGGSDFYLVRLTNFTLNNAKSVNAVYNGWDRSTTSSTGGGAGIHHPAGDIKKISLYTQKPTTATYSGGSGMNCASSAHWKITWSEAVTEGGSSGSPIFNNNGLVFGTLSGGASSCDASTYSRYDLYGKMSVHWSNAANGSASSNKLQPWLDPTGTNATTCPYFDPNNSSVDPTASFSYNFESCTAWAVDDFAPCTTYDGDGSTTYGINNVTFTNSGYKGSYIAFKNGTANGFTAHSGTQFGCCMAAETPPNNDWFIIPPIAIQNGTTFSFWARSANDTYGLEQFQVGISQDDQNYSLIGGTTDTPLEAPVEWTHYSFDLSHYAGQTLYIAIICVSNDAFAFFIDDISVSNSLSASEIDSDLVSIYPNPTKELVNVCLPETDATINIVNVLGQTVKTVVATSANENISLEGLESGVYFFNIKLKDKNITRKVVVE